MQSLFTGVSGDEFQKLAALRLEEARALHAVGKFDGAYYLGGYAVECALKAVVTRKIVANVLPPKGSVEKVYTHSLEDLLKLAGLHDQLKTMANLGPNWSIVNQWRETKRYERGVDSATASDFLRAVDDPADGVLTWLKQSW